MATRSPVVVPAIPPRRPQVNLIDSSIRPSDKSDPAAPIFEISGEQMALLPADLQAELQARKGKAWTRGITYAPENHFPAEMRDGCDFTSIDEPALQSPANLAAEQKTTGGTIPAGEREYVITAVNANGETLPSTAATVTTTGATSSVKLTWKKVASGITYKLYGRTKGSTLGLIATIGPLDKALAAEYLDTGTPAPGAVVPVANTTGGIGSYTNLAVVTAIPSVVLVEDSCSTFGFEERDFKGRALRLLDAATPKALEAEFERGAVAKAKGLPNNYLIKEGAVTDKTPATPPTLARGLNILQQALAECGFGGQGMIHMPVFALPNLLNVRNVGKMVYDQIGNIIVPGVGYTGAAPEGHAATKPGNTWIYATDLVMTRTEDGEAQVFPDTLAEAMDWGQAGQPNTLRFRAQQFAVAYFDGACQFGCEVKLPE